MAKHEPDRHSGEAAGASPEPPQTSRPLVRPPILYAASIALGLLLHRIAPLRLGPERLTTRLGLALASGAVVLFISAVLAFRRARTPIPSTRPTTAIVRSGPYRFSRNPIYVAFTLLQIGVALWANSCWVLGLLPPTVALLFYGVVRREEAYLERRFGQEYATYKASVRRWL